MPTISEQIRRLRAAAGLTQEELAHKAGMKFSTFVQIEKGRVPNPRIDTLRKIARALDVTLDELAGDEDGGEEEPARKRPRKRK